MKGTAVLAMEENGHHIGARVTNEFGGKGRPGASMARPVPSLPAVETNPEGKISTGISSAIASRARPHRHVVFHGGLARREVHRQQMRRQILIPAQHGVNQDAKVASPWPRGDTG